MDTTTPATQQIPVDKIVPSPFQARKSFDEASIKELAQTIKDRGLLQPIVVRETSANDASRDAIYELLAGERRWRAVKLLGWQTIEAKVEVVDDKEAALRGIVENVQREDLSPIEQALGYRKLTQPPFSLNQSDIADMVGKDRTLVNKCIAVAGLADHPGGVNQFTPLPLKHLIELSRLSDNNDQANLAVEATKKDLSVDQLKALVDQKVGPKKAKAKASGGLPSVALAKEGEASDPDPLSDIWEPMLMQSTGSGKFWGVTYGPQQLPGMKGVSIPAWHFWVPNRGMTPKGDLKAWFLQMAAAMGDTDQEAEQIMRDMGHVRLPQNPEESAELEKLADQGPEAEQPAQPETAQPAPEPVAADSTPLTAGPSASPERAEASRRAAAVASPVDQILGEGAGKVVADVAKNLLGGLF